MIFKFWQKNGLGVLCGKIAFKIVTILLEIIIFVSICRTFTIHSAICENSSKFGRGRSRLLVYRQAVFIPVERTRVIYNEVVAEQSHKLLSVAH